MALLLPEADVAFQILALNTEKAHNLKERSLEVIRMLRGLVEVREGTELDVAPLLEEPAFVTLGAAYEKRPRLSGGAYHSIVKRIDGFLDEPLAEALGIREERADTLLKLDDAVSGAVERLKARGMVSPYLRAFVVARINYLRFVKLKPGAPPPEFDATLEKLTRSAEKFNAEKVQGVGHQGRRTGGSRGGLSPTAAEALAAVDVVRTQDEGEVRRAAHPGPAHQPEGGHARVGQRDARDVEDDAVRARRRDRKEFRS